MLKSSRTIDRLIHDSKIVSRVLEEKKQHQLLTGIRFRQ